MIESCDLTGSIADHSGHVLGLHSLTVNANDIHLSDVQAIRTSFGGTLGMSGGPLIRRSTDDVIGLMSIGLPADAPVKETLFAISAVELIRVLNTK